MKSARVEWVDTARGIAIIAVVMFHSAIFLTEADSAWRWGRVMYSLETFRMPLFFFAAGLFSAKIIALTFAMLWRSRIALFLYLYVLWSVIRWIYFQLVPFVLPRSDASDWRELISIFVWPAGGLWFLYALAIYSVFVWLCRRLPLWVPMSISVATSIAFSSEIIRIDNDPWMKIGSYGAFFVAAVYLSKWALATASRMRIVTAVALIVVYAIGAIAYQFFGLAAVVGLRFAVSIAGVCAGVALSVLLARVGWFGWLSWLGRKTLPIYLVHYLPIAAVAAVLVSTGTVLPEAIGAIAVPVLAAASIAIALLLDQALRPIHGVFDLPWSRSTRQPPAHAPR